MVLSSYYSVNELWFPEATRSITHVGASPPKTETKLALMWAPHEATSFVVDC